MRLTGVTNISVSGYGLSKYVTGIGFDPLVVD